jgi:hypothetical protein
MNMKKTFHNNIDWNNTFIDDTEKWNKKKVSLKLFAFYIYDVGCMHIGP